MNPTVPTLTRADCELLARYADARVRWTRIDATSKRKLTNLRARIKALLTLATERTPLAFPVKTFITTLHQHDRVPADYWGCLYPATVPNKAFALQLAIVVSSTGAELSCCMGTDRRESRDPDVAARNRRALEEVQQQLAYLPPELVTTVEARLRGDWRFRRSLRQSPRSADFETFTEWAHYAASPLGAGASISCNLSPRTLDKAGEGIVGQFVTMMECFAPLLHHLYAEGALAPSTPEPPLPKSHTPTTHHAHTYGATPYEPSPNATHAPHNVAEHAAPYDTTGTARPAEPIRPATPVTIDDAAADLFFPRDTFAQLLTLLQRRHNLILEGAPGVGKTFVARRLASALLGSTDPTRTEIVQFHQSYSYEDFVQGWRPAAGGGFVLRNGVFYEFCQLARRDPNRPYVFVIDEINRGNVSKIFGELLMLLERDKRGDPFAVPLTYTIGKADRFAVPPNLYLIGTMNTADRSIAMVDYALRRRFAFARLHPAFGSREFTRYLTRQHVPKPLIRRITDRMRALNEEILDDRKRLGPGFEIGHSFFVPSDGDGPYDDNWYHTIIMSEIEPLLREYWFDDPDRVGEAVAQLLAPS